MNHIKRFSPPILALSLPGPIDASANDEQGVAADPVMAIFQHMLGYDSSHSTLLTPSSSDEDPLRSAVNMALWRSKSASFHIANDHCH